MGATVDRLSLVKDAAPGSAAELAGVKTYLRVEHAADDAAIQAMIEGAKQLADDYLSNPFQTVALDGSLVNLEIPASVRLWCLTMVARQYENRVGATAAGFGGLGYATYGPNDYRALAPHRRLPGL